MNNLWLKYAHLGDPNKPTLNPLTPAHVRGKYEKGRWARVNGVSIHDCPYGHPDYDDNQEWVALTSKAPAPLYIGWLEEDEAIVLAIPVRDEDFVEF